MKKILVLTLVLVLFAAAAGFAELAGSDPIELSGYLGMPAAEYLPVIPGMELYDDFAATPDFEVYTSFSEEDINDTDYISVSADGYSIFGFVIGADPDAVAASLTEGGYEFSLTEESDPLNTEIFVYTIPDYSADAYMSFTVEDGIVTEILLGHI